MKDTAKIQQRHKGPRLEKAARSRNQGDILWGPQTNSWARHHQASGWDFCQDLENECWGTVEEPATIQAKEDTTNSLRARDVGA
jgi:hypothetical protein